MNLDTTTKAVIRVNDTIQYTLNGQRYRGRVVGIHARTVRVELDPDPLLGLPRRWHSVPYNNIHSVV